MSLTLCIRLRHLPNQLRLLTRSFFAKSSRACVWASGSNLCLPAYGSSGGRDGAFTSRPCTCQTLFTGIPTSSSISSKSWRTIRLWRALRRLRQWRCHSIWHRQARGTGLRSKCFVAGGVSRCLLVLLLLYSRRWQIIKQIELVAVAEVALALRLGQFLWGRRVTTKRRWSQVSSHSSTTGSLSVHLTTYRQA